MVAFALFFPRISLETAVEIFLIDPNDRECIKKLQSWTVIFISFSALRVNDSTLRPSPSIEATKRPSARQWRARVAAADTPGMGAAR